MLTAYPRPQLRRDSYFCLNGEWELTIAQKDSDMENAFFTVIQVPYPPESKTSGVGRRIAADEVMYYHKTFSVPVPANQDRTILHFGAVDQQCEVMLNGQRLGEHKGGYLPFSFDITDVLQERNELIVKAVDTLDHTYPWGKQRNDNGGMWYTPFSGIWQTVWIEQVPQRYITSLKLTPSLHDVRIEISDNTGKAAETELVVETPNGSLTWRFCADAVNVPIPEPKLWAPENPYLYRFSIRRGEDAVKSYFAMRTVSVGEVDGIPRILLNGKPYFFHGLLDQGYWENGICLPDSDDGYEKDIRFAKSLGFNMLRKHIRIEPLPFYEACDRLGMIVFQDFVNNGPHRYYRDTLLPNIGFVYENDTKRRLPEAVKTVFRQTMADTVRHLYNAPCIAYWTIFNEGWGQHDADAMYTLLQSLDDTRVIDATSGWFWQSQSDVDSYHMYFAQLKQFGGKRPLVLSEFGGYSYNSDGKRYGYRFFKTEQAYREAICKLYREQIIPAVKKGLCAAVYTQISDVEDEQNGLITYDRAKEKVSAYDMLPIANELYGQIQGWNTQAPCR